MRKIVRIIALQSLKKHGLMILLMLFLLMVSSVSAASWNTTFFNNSLSSENLTLIGNNNITRYLAVPQGIINLSIAKFNISYASGIYANISRNVTFTNTSVQGITAIRGITFCNNSFFAIDATTAIIYRYKLNGTYDSFNFSTTPQAENLPLGITCFNDTSLFIAGSTNSLMYRYKLNGTYDNFNFSIIGYSSGLGRGISLYNNSFYIAEEASNEILVYNLSGNITRRRSYGAQTTSGRGVSARENVILLASSSDNLIYVYYNNLTYTGFYYMISDFVEGITSFNNSLYVTQNSGNDLVFKYPFSMNTLSITLGSNVLVNTNLEFNQTNNQTFINSIVNSYLSSCSFANGYCNMPFQFHSDIAGVLQYNDLNFNGTEFIENNQTFNNQTTRGATETFTMNFSYSSFNYPSINGILVYNGTNYTGTKTGSGNNVLFSKILVIPNLIQTNNFYWAITLTNATGNYYFQSKSYNQTVFGIDIDNCASYTNVLYNFTMYDEDTLVKLNGTIENTTIETFISLYSTSGVFVSNYSFNFSNKNPVALCLSSNTLNFTNYTIEMITRYDGSSYVSEFYNEQNTLLTTSNIPKIISLYPLLTTRSQEFKLVFKGASLFPLVGYLVQVNRKYLSDGSYKTVEIGKTDSDGIVLEHFVLSEVYYKLTITKDGVIFYTYPDFQAICANAIIGDCEIDKFLLDSPLPINDFNTLYGIQLTPVTYNKTTRVLSTTFQVIDGSSPTITLEVDDVNGVPITSTSLTSSSGTLNLGVPLLNIGGGNGMTNITFYPKVKKTVNGNNQTIFSGAIELNTSPAILYGNAKAIMIVGLILTMIMMVVASGEIMIIMLILGLTMSAGLGLISAWTSIGLGILGIFIYPIIVVIAFIIKSKWEERE